jgi:DNA-3-methyladenine glycosylase II
MPPSEKKKLTEPFSMKKAVAHLKKQDEVMAKIIKTIGLCTLFERKRLSGFETLYRTIASQQLSKKAAATICGRVKASLNGKMITPQNILEIDAATLRSAGLSARKVEYIHSLAQMVVDKELSFRKLNAMSDDEVIETLTQIRGIGRWSAEMYMLFTMYRQDVFPFDDVAILNVMAELYSITDRKQRDEYEAISNHWRPYRSVAVWYLYSYVNMGRERGEA